MHSFNMAMSIADLDKTVRSFYEDRGEPVSASLLQGTAMRVVSWLWRELADLFLLAQQKQAEATLNQV